VVANKLYLGGRMLLPVSDLSRASFLPMCLVCSPWLVAHCRQVALAT